VGVAGAVAVVLAGGSAAGPAKNPTIVVNATGDVPDPKPADGVCAVKALAKGGPKTYCTLRGAIQTANGRAGPDVILLAAGTFKLTAPGRGEEKAAKGDLDVAPNGRITIVGKGPAATIVDGGGLDRVFDVGVWGNLVVTGVRIKGGHEKLGGGIRVSSNGRLSLGQSVVDGNVADGADVTLGGGIYVEELGSARLTRVTVSHNVARHGAGILTYGNVDLTNVTIAGNNAGGYGGGIGVVAGKTAKVDVTLLGVTVAGNTGPLGSAVFIGSAIGYVHERNSIFSGSCSSPGQVLEHFFSTSGNVMTDFRCGKGGSADKVGDPGVGLLTTVNGFPVLPLQAGSAALGFAVAGSCLPIDEVGTKRPQGAGCDSGAYESASG
jgi:hypothetical protein